MLMYSFSTRFLNAGFNVCCPHIFCNPVNFQGVEQLLNGDELPLAPKFGSKGFI